MSLDFGLTGVHVIVTGASGGIGIATTRLLVLLGAKVTAHYNSSKGELGSLPGVVTLQADVRNEASIKTLFEEATRQSGPVSILVVNRTYTSARASSLLRSSGAQQGTQISRLATAACYNDGFAPSEMSRGRFVV